MIYKMTFKQERIDWCTANDVLHLLQSYDNEYEFNIQDLEKIEEIPEDKAKELLIENAAYDEDEPNDMSKYISLYDLAAPEQNDFTVVASTEIFALIYE